jgi:hypothetical protein
MRAVAEDIARHLIQQQDQRQRPVGFLQQRLVLAPRRGEVVVEKTRTQLGVERGVFREPLRGAGGAPETNDFCQKEHH